MCGFKEKYFIVRFQHIKELREETMWQIMKKSSVTKILKCIFFRKRKIEIYLPDIENLTL